MKAFDQNQKKKEYMKMALGSVLPGNDDISYYLKVIASSLITYHLVRVYNFNPAIGSSLIDCDCGDHTYRQTYCKHMQVGFMYFTGSDELLDWDLAFVVVRQLRELRLLDLVNVGHLADFSLTLGLLSDTCPLPRWRVKTLQDWALTVLPELLAELEQNREVA